MQACLLLLGASSAALLGCGYLALSQERHAETVLGRDTYWPMRQLAPPIGWSLLVLSLVLCILRDGGGFALLLWPLLTGAGAFTMAVTLTYRPTLLAPLTGRWRPLSDGRQGDGPS